MVSVSLSKNKQLEESILTTCMIRHIPWRKRQMNLLLGVKSVALVCTGPTMYNGVYTFFSQDACMFNSEKGKIKRYHKNHV